MAINPRRLIALLLHLIVLKPLLHLGHHWANAVASNGIVPLAEGDGWLLSLPLYHVAGMGVLFRCLLARATIVIPSAHRHPLFHLPRFAPIHSSRAWAKWKSIRNLTSTT